MLKYRDNVIYCDKQTLLKEQSNVQAQGLACQVDDGASPPAMRQRLTVDLLVEDWRCGPLTAEVVFVAGDKLGLHLSESAVEQIQQLIRRIKTTTRTEAAITTAIDQGRSSRPTGTFRVGLGSELEAIAAESEGLDTEAAGDEVKLVKLSPGWFGSKLGLGGLKELFVVDRRQWHQPGDQASAIHVFGFLHQQKATGELVVASKNFTKHVWFRSGVPLTIAVSPVKEDELLGQILLKAKWISPQLLAEGLRWGKQQRIGLGTALVKAGKLEEGNLRRALAHQTYRRLQNIFTWNHPRFEFVAGKEPPPPPYHPVAVPRLMFELAHEALRAARLEHLQLLLKVYDEAFPRLTCDETRLKTLMPGERTRRVCQQLFDGTRPLRHTLTASVLGRPKTVRLVLYLQAAEAIEFAVLPVDQQNAAALAQERLRVLKMQDCYQRLCLPYVAHAETIDAVYQRRRDEVAPRSRLHQADAASSSEAQTLLQEAASMLGTPASRRRYREKHLKPDALTFLAAVVREEAELASLHGDSSRARKLQQTVEELV